MTAREAFYKHSRTMWTLTKPLDPVQVELDIMDWHIAKLNLAKDFYTEEHGFEPELPIKDSCATGDWSDSAVELHQSQEGLKNVKHMILGLRNGTVMLYQWGGIGYLLQGKWNEAPEHLKEYLKTRFADGVNIP